MDILGIDIGGSSIKAAIVNTKKAELLSNTLNLKTIPPMDVSTLSEQLVAIKNHFKWEGKIGCAFPSVIKNGQIKTTANFDPSWLSINTSVFLAERLGSDIKLINDADAAGIAEMNNGAGKKLRGTTLVLTFGTGIGTALFIDKKLFPNTELGHLEIDGVESEKFAAASVKAEKDLSWHEWSFSVQKYINVLENLLWPDNIIIGGAISQEYDQFSHLIKTKADVVKAKFFNNSGLIGAAIYAVS